MQRKLAALGLGVVLMAAAACSSTSSTTTTTAASGGGTSTTAASGGTSTTKAGGATSKITKPEVDKSKIDPAKIPSGVKTAKNIDLTEEESDCISYVIVLAYEADPTLGTDDATASGVAGGAIVACVPKDKIAAGIVSEMKKGAPDLTSAQAACVEKEINAAPDDALTLFIAALAYGSAELLDPFVTELSKACSGAT
jgi:hypothetical protein